MQSNSITLKQLTNYLDTYLESSKFNEKAYNGVQISTTVPITKIATAVSVSREVIEMAIKEKAQALIVHHGLFRQGDSHPLRGILYDRVKLLMDNNIALLGYHLPLDAHQTIGNNWKVARDLGLTNLQSYLEYSGSEIGVVGDISEQPFDLFKSIIEKYYDHPAWFVKAKNSVSKVAIVSGGAEKFLKNAASVGADCYITGSVDEVTWDDAAEYGVSYIGVGHYGSEVIAVNALVDILKAQFQIEAVFLKTKNPF